jgi:hypothetical protein
MSESKSYRNAQIETERNAGATLDALASKYSLSEIRGYQCRLRPTPRSRAKTATRSMPSCDRYPRFGSRTGHMNSASPSTFADPRLADTVFGEGEYKPDPEQSDRWNRSAYLVVGLGHCGMCHTPINALGSCSESKAFSGRLDPDAELVRSCADLQSEAGLGDWSLQEIATNYLKTDVSACAPSTT